MMGKLPFGVSRVCSGERSSCTQYALKNDRVKDAVEVMETDNVTLQVGISIDA